MERELGSKETKQRDSKSGNEKSFTNTKTERELLFSKK